MICCICKIDKPVTEFHKDSSRKNGHVFQCKPCISAKQKRFYQKNSVGVLVKDDQDNEYTVRNNYRPVSDKKRLATKRYYHTEKGRSIVRESLRKSYLRNKVKWQARAKLRYAVKKGEIVKPDECEKRWMSDMPCSKGKPQAHHHLGYEGDHWKDVLWLCSSHHGKEHRKYLWDEEHNRVLIPVVVNDLAKNKKEEQPTYMGKRLKLDHDKKGNNDNQS